MLTIRQIFLYLDRTFVLSSSTRSLSDMGLQLLGQKLAEKKNIERKVVEGLLMLVEKERNGGDEGRVVGARALLQSVSGMLRSLKIYSLVFERPFVEQSTIFYRQEGNKLVNEMGLSAYLKHCEKRLSEEHERCTAYLDASTRKPLIEVVESQLISQHLPSILSSASDASSQEGGRGMAGLIDRHKVDDMARLYRLASRVGSLEALRSAVKDHVRSSGILLVKDEEKDKEMVERLLDLKQKMDEMLLSALNKNESFATAIKEAFESFVNQRQNKPAEMIAKFVDGMLRGVKPLGSSSASALPEGEDTEALMDRILVLFRFIQGKDVFEAFYKKDLAKRLLLGKSASIDSEKSMISKLKQECGSAFTNKLEGMFKDVELSADVMANFRISSQFLTGLPPGLDVNVQVLTSGFWPSYPTLEAKMPQELDQSQAAFKDFYLQKYSGRKLAWHGSLGTCIVRASFSKGDKELSMSQFQTIVMCLFNGTDSLSLSEIKAQTGIEDKELRRTLQSLACGKFRVLSKEPKGKEVEDEDVFRYNEDFNDKLYRIKINQIQMKETEEENKKTNDEILQDRQYQIDAAIVRIMKTRKQLSHKLLISEVIAQLKFPLRAVDLKKRIESLIDREYLQREATDPNVYNYLA